MGTFAASPPGSFGQTLLIWDHFFASSGICFAISLPVKTNSNDVPMTCTLHHPLMVSAVSESVENIATNFPVNSARWRCAFIPSKSICVSSNAFCILLTFGPTPCHSSPQSRRHSRRSASPCNSLRVIPLRCAGVTLLILQVHAYPLCMLCVSVLTGRLDVISLCIPGVTCLAPQLRVVLLAAAVLFQYEVDSCWVHLLGGGVILFNL